MKWKGYILTLLIGIIAGYMLKDQLTPPCETQVIKNLKTKGDGNTVTIEQVKELKQALDDCEKAVKKEDREARKQKRKSKTNE